MRIITVPLLSGVIPVVAMLGLFWALWGCPVAGIVPPSRSLGGR